MSTDENVGFAYLCQSAFSNWMFCLQDRGTAKKCAQKGLEKCWILFLDRFLFEIAGWFAGQLGDGLWCLGDGYAVAASGLRCV
jgi:hypothetical protein